MKKIFIVLASVSALMFMLGATGVAAKGNGRGKGGSGEDRMERREDMKKKIKVLKTAWLIEELELEGDQLTEVLGIIGEIDDLKEENRDRFRTIRDGLEEEIEKEEPDEGRIEELLDELEEVQDDQQEKKEDLQEELKKKLTPVQQAKYIISGQKFMRYMKDIVSQHRGGAQGRGREGGMGGRQGGPPEGQGGPPPWAGHDED